MTGLILGLMLLAQGQGGGLAPPPALGSDVPALRPLTPDNSAPAGIAPPASTPGTHAPTPAASNAGRSSASASDRVADAMRLPAGAALSGQPLTLVAALGHVADRRTQLDAVRAYWRLLAAVGEYRFALDHSKTIEGLTARGRDEATLRAARSAAAAQLRQSELDAIAAQHELAGLVRLSADAALPLCADQPCVGVYGTRFKEMFANRTPPEQARLAEKVLPLQRQVIDDRAAAVQAAEDALAAVTDDYRSGRSDAAAVTSCSRELFRQRRELLRAVADYNRQIADYAFLVVPPTSSVQDLVRCLIGPAQKTSASDGQPPARQARADSPTPREPTLARRPRPVESAPVSPDSGWHPVERSPAARVEGLRPTGRNEPTLAPPRDVETPAMPSEIPANAAPSNDSPRLRTTNKAVQPSELPGDSIAQAWNPPARSPSVQPSLGAAPRADVAPSLRPKQLTERLQAGNEIWEGEDTKPISLGDCLLRDANGNRRATIETYWLVWQQAARCRALADEQIRLKKLAGVVLERRNSPTGAADMLRLQAAQTATKASLSQAKAALAEAQYALALRTGMAAEAAWPRPSTSPHSGSYLLRLEAQPRSVAETRAARRLAATIPGLAENLQQWAAAVAETATACTANIENYRVGAASIDRVIESLAEETEQTTAFADALTQYNGAIAEYALLVLPTGAPANKLVESLVAKP
ncbi:MAG: hypothetical protein ABFC63_06890 [Thermoguttaceae bacterium]